MAFGDGLLMLLWLLFFVYGWLRFAWDMLQKVRSWWRSHRLPFGLAMHAKAFWLWM